METNRYKDRTHSGHGLGDAGDGGLCAAGTVVGAGWVLVLVRAALALRQKFSAWHYNSQRTPTLRHIHLSTLSVALIISAWSRSSSPLGRGEGGLADPSSQICPFPALFSQMASWSHLCFPSRVRGLNASRGSFLPP